MNARLCGLLILSMTLACAAWGFQQPRHTVAGGTGSLVTFNKVLVSFRPVLNSEGQGFVQARTYVGDDAIERIIFNADGSLYFGYDLIVEAVPNSNQFLVTVKALSPDSLQKFRPFTSGGGGGRAVGGARGDINPRVAMAQGVPRAVAGVDATQVQPNVTFSPSQYSASQRVFDGDVLSLDLLTNPATGGKISDIIKIASTNRIMMQNTPSAGARANAGAGVPDITNIWAFGFDVVVDGKLTATVESGGCTGKLVYFSFEPKQRFIMSTQPYDGYEFAIAGMIDGNAIRFDWNGNTYQLLCSEPVLEGGAKVPLWLLVDTGPENPEGSPVINAKILLPKTVTGGNAAGTAGSGATGGGVGGRGAGVGGGVARGVVGANDATLSVVRVLPRVNCGAASDIESLLPKK